MKSKQYVTGHEKRKLAYNSHFTNEPLELPEQYKSKISHIQHKRVKQAFFVQSSSDLKLDRQSFVKTIRSLGIVAKTTSIYELFKEPKGGKINWETFLGAYVELRNCKGSFKEVDTAVNLLDREYNGRWQQLFPDLKTLGDPLTEREMRIFKQEILGDKILNGENLKNVLLGYK